MPTRLTVAVRLLFAATVVLTTASAPLRAQDPAAAQAIAKAKAALAPVDWMVGQWEGDASVMAGPGQQIAVRQHEDVVRGASGTVLIIRGTGRDPQTRAINFEAAATLWLDESGALAMRTHRDGRSVVPSVEMRGDSLVWGFPVPGGRVRYTIWRGAGDTWEEIGEFLREGAAPMRIITMSLRRKPVSP